MKVLLLHQHFKTPQTGGALRSYYLAKALVDKGVNTIVITAHAGPGYKNENVDGIDVHYLSIPYNNRFGFYKRINAFIRFVTGSVGLSSKFRDIDLCYAISVPLTVGLAAMWIKSKLKVPYIFEVGDLWPEAPVQMGVIKSKLLSSALYSLERKIYGGSRSIVALSTSIKAHIEQLNTRKPIYVLPNMADTEFFKPSLKHPDLEKKYDVSKKFVVSYIGAIGVANGLDYYLECARACQKAGMNVHFLMCGDGAMLDSLSKSAKNLDLHNISFIPFQNREGVRELLNVTDASFISYKPVPVLETGSPNKYFDSLAAGKLILINFGGWIKNEIEMQQCGLYIEKNQPTDIVDKLNRFVDDPALLMKYQQASRALAENSYSRNKLSAQFVDIITQSY